VDAITELGPGAQVESQNKGIKQIFRKIQPAFALRIVLKVPVPCASLLQFGRIVSQKQGRQPRIRGHSRQSGLFLQRGIQRAVFVSGAVVVAECNQRLSSSHKFFWPFKMIVLFQFVLHHRAVLTVNHEDSLLNFNAFDFVSENRKRIAAETA